MDQLDQQKESHDENDVAAAADDDENDHHVATVNAVLNTTERADHPICADNEGRLVNFPKKLDDDHDHKIHQQTVNANTQNAVADEEEIQPIPSAVTETLPHNHNDRDTDNDHNIDGMLLLPPNDYGRKSNYYNMSRQSTVSSLAGNSIDLGITGVGDITDDPMNDDNDYDIDDHINIDHVVLNALPENVLLDRVRFPEDLSLNNNNNNMEERSIRSDRPDPPPSSDIIMTMLPMENHNSSSDNNIDTTEMNADPNVTTTSHYHDNDTNNNNNPIITKQQHRHVTTAEENFAVEALASLSINMAEITLSEEYNPINNSNNNTLVQQQQQAPDPSATVGNVHHLQHDIMNNEWDMNRPALLAETPNIVTLRKTSSLKAMAYQNNTSSNTDNDHFHVDGNNHSNTTIPYHRSLSVPKIYNVPTTTSTMQYTNNPIVSSNLDNTIATTTTTDTVHVGADHLIVLPRVDEGNRFFYHPPNTNPQQYQYTSTDIPPPPQNQLKQPNIPHNHMPNITTMNSNNTTNSTGHHSSNKTPSGRRKIRLRLQEEIRNNNATNITKKRHTRSTSLLGSIRKSSTRMLRFSGVGSGGVGSNGMSFLSNWEEEEDNFDAMTTNNNLYTIVDRGHLMVGWFDGTSTFELQQHIHKSVLRKLQQLFSVVGDNNKNGNNASDIIDIEDLRILDESFDPPEDVVLSPHIPDGSHFLLRFGTIRAGKAKKNETRMKMDYHDGTMTPMSIYSGRAPDSPSAAPSPHFDKFLLNGLNANQIALLNSLNIPTDKPMNRRSSTTLKNQIEPPPQDGTRRASTDKYSEAEPTDANQTTHPKDASGTINDEGHEESSKRIDSNGGQFLSEISSDDDENADDATMMLHSDDPIEARLREITDLLLLDRKKERYRRYDRQREKRQVVFVVANYFVLFLAIIAISAELQARAPNWIKMMEEHLQNVQNCSENHEALFECVSRGDFAGLIASVVLWLSRSVTTKRIFLFGFDTPKKLWTVVYESLVTSVCWGISYLFIRRGMNPDTRPRFVQKYWKDAVYGSLAGFNAAFLKHILKNLIPEQVVEDALRERQLKIMGWLPSFHFR